MNRTEPAIHQSPPRRLERLLQFLVVAGLPFSSAPLLAIEDAQQDAIAAAATSAYSVPAEIGREGELRGAIEVEQVRQLAPAQPIAAHGLLADEMAGVNYRYWVGRGRSELGFGLGSVGYLLPRESDGSRQLIGAVPTVSFGVRHRIGEDYRVFADASGARGLGIDPSATSLTTRFGVEWAPAKSRWGIAQGALGLQLDSDRRVSVRLRHGRPLIYYRSRF